jgi:diacylglycerol kinase family enzyme
VFHLTLIVNPFATRVSGPALASVVGELERVARVDTKLTERRGHATELARAVGNADAVVVFGGDGVANETVNGLEGDVPLGALPGGNTSVFARALGLPRDPARAAARVADAFAARRTRPITLGRANGRRFTFACGVGLDAATVRRVDALGRARDGRRAGDLAFSLEMARVLAQSRFRLEPSLEVDGLGRAAAAFVANCDPYTYAGPVALHIAPEARFELGLDVVAPVRLTGGMLPRYARYVLRGAGQERDGGILYAHDRDRIEISCDRPLPHQVDGEDLGDTQRLSIVAEREALTVLV